MDKIREVLVQVRRSSAELMGLAGACGPSPDRAPPTEKSIRKARAKVAAALGISKRQGEAHHDASPWRWHLVDRVQELAEDPDRYVGEWLRDGAPFGVAREIVPGGLLPRITEEASLTMEQLYEQQAFDDNHGSFREVVEGKQPALDELQQLVDLGFARVCKDLDSAERLLGRRPVVSPLGNVVKLKPDLTRKNRLIQDFRASAVNSASVVHERQVLPRFCDHAHDIAALSALGSSVGVFVLDFKHAFMTVPLAKEEMAFNASVIPAGIRRNREPLEAGEPTEGTILLWRVLGFGGHANPLVYSRVASFAARSGQGLLYHPSSVSGLAHGRLQLYVDDPALTLAGSEEEQNRAIDLLVLWFLVLGIPLSWQKGFFGQIESGHTWIGVRFGLAAPGVASLTLPEECCKELLHLAQQFADKKVKVMLLKQAHELCGRAGRVAQVVPYCRSFLSC